MRHFLLSFLLWSTFVSADTVIPSSWMAVIQGQTNAKVTMTVVSPTVEHRYSFVRSSQKRCDVSMVHDDGKDSTWPLVQTPPSDIPVYNALIAMHEVGHCVMDHHESLLKKNDLWVQENAVLERKTWLGGRKEVELDVWYEEHFADMYSVLWLSHVVDERDFGIIIDYLVTLRENNRQDLEHNTLAMLKNARANYWAWRQTPVKNFTLTAAVESISSINSIINKEEWNLKANT